MIDLAHYIVQAFWFSATVGGGVSLYLVASTAFSAAHTGGEAADASHGGELPTAASTAGDAHLSGPEAHLLGEHAGGLLSDLGHADHTQSAVASKEKPGAASAASSMMAVFTSPRTVAAAMAGFGTTGLAASYAGVGALSAAAIAAPAGLTAGAFVHYLMQSLSSFDHDGAVHPQHLLGARGKLHLSVEGELRGMGKALVVAGGRTLEIDVRTTGSRIENGETIQVVGWSQGVALVEPVLPFPEDLPSSSNSQAKTQEKKWS